jgi:hypothetical protein
LAAADELGRFRRQTQNLRIDQRVTDHHVRASQQFGCAQREQPDIAGSRADQINHAFEFHGGILYAGSGRAAIG